MPCQQWGQEGQQQQVAAMHPTRTSSSNRSLVAVMVMLPCQCVAAGILQQ
jgi:hypothetical protein